MVNGFTGYWANSTSDTYRYVELTPSEQDRLLIFTAASLAKSRRASGLKLNKPEAVAIISDAVIEAARAGANHEQALHAGKTAITKDQLLEGVGPLLSGISIEAVFDDGRRLVVIDFDSDEHDYAGKVTRLAPIGYPANTDVVRVRVQNKSSVQISITSHMHFLEVNPKLLFNRELAYGRRLNIETGTHVDFAPNEIVEVELIPIAGERVLIGFAGIVDGPLDAPGAKETALTRLAEFGYLTGEPA